MAESGWRRLAGIEKRVLAEARLEAHYAVQWLARFARAYIPPVPDDSHTSLVWSDELGGFSTHPLDDGARLRLSLMTLDLSLDDSARPARTRSLSLDGRSDAQIRLWLGELLAARGLDAEALEAPAPYEIPDHGIARGAAYRAAAAMAALGELAAWYANGAFLIDRVRREAIGRGVPASALCCWPHHFDLATLTTLPPKAGSESGSIGIGLSPGDEYYDEPYFYVSVYPAPAPEALPRLPAPGHWHTHEFTSAIARASGIIAAPDQAAAAGAFLDSAVAAASTLLS